jgi:hypothetical protein
LYKEKVTIGMNMNETYKTSGTLLKDQMWEPWAHKKNISKLKGKNTESLFSKTGETFPNLEEETAIHAKKAFWDSTNKTRNEPP